MKEVDVAHVWIRRCSACGADDLDAAFGRAVVDDDAGWSCRWCGSARWEAAGMAMPLDAAVGTAACPFLAR